ncbi:MAG: hypothetical protein GXP46_00210 [Deferribacteres bacterium]|nr:hypothetical protein [Deferribacteres bacterium]
MSILNRFKIFLILNITVLMLLSSASDVLSTTATVSPDSIKVDSFYHGSKITIKGETEADKEIIIKISSPPIKTSLRKKGKAAGILWMNIGELEFHPVPDVYFIYSTQDINTILGESEQDKYTIGYDAFKRLVEVSPVSDDAEKKKWVEEFIKFKEKNKVYGVFPGKIEASTGNGKKTYTLVLDWPYQAPPQEYTISIYAVKDGVVQYRTEQPLIVEKTGALRFLSNMAFNNAAVYGIVSIIIAIVAGFVVSLIFRGESKGGH